MVDSSFWLNLKCFFIISKYAWIKWAGSETLKAGSGSGIIIPDQQHCLRQNIIHNKNLFHTHIEDEEDGRGDEELIQQQLLANDGQAGADKPL